MKLLRVGVLNNFNFSDKEIEYLQNNIPKEYQIFVNSNSYVKIRKDFASIVTINPHLDSFVCPKGDLSNLKACRVKYIHDGNKDVNRVFIQSVLWCKKNLVPILITYFRFGTLKNLVKYTNIPKNVLDMSIKQRSVVLKEHGYKWDRSYFRPTRKQVFADKDVFYCDYLGKGCPKCNNCACLAVGRKKNISLYSINLSASGRCAYGCPDCFGQRLVRLFPHAIAFDKITRNRKQKGILHEPFKFKNNRNRTERIA